MFDIRQTIRKVIGIQAKKAEDKNIRLYALYKNIEGEEGHNHSRLIDRSKFIYTDEKRLMQVLLNLQSNALKFTEMGQVRIEVEIVYIGLEEFLKVSVIDSGVGISEDNQQKLFQLFGFVQDTQSLNTNGIGLGLVISKQIVNQFGGEINVKSNLGEGSTFWFTFRLESSENP